MSSGNKGWISFYKGHRNEGKFTPWECAFERDHVPPVTPEADKIFQAARAMQRDTPNPTEADKIRIFQMYKQAADMGHWKAMHNLANCYLNKWGTKFSVTAPDEIYEAMMARGIPSGYMGKALLTRRGWAVEQDPKEARRLMHKAADLGSPIAQYELGMYYYLIEHRSSQGFAYNICATRQGYAKSAYQVGYQLSSEGNLPMALEYYYRGAALGHSISAMSVEDVFSEREGGESLQTTLGFNENLEIAKAFSEYYDFLLNRPDRRIPDIFKNNPIPAHPSISREQSRDMPSKLKDAFGGRWPDEIFPELAPDYMPPPYE